jgi:hypothetical protein
VNAAGGGTGGAAVGSIAVGSGGGITVATNTGGNATGGSITQPGGGLLNAGTGPVALTTPAGGASGIGTGVSPIQVAAGAVTATSGSGGVFISETDGASFTVTAAGAGPVSLTSGGPFTIAGPITSGTGPVDLRGATVVQSSSVSTGGTGSVTVTATAGGITMADSTSTTAAGTGTISYVAPGTVTLGLLSAPGNSVSVTSTGGSILDGNAAPLNIAAGGGATLTAGGVIGLLAAPIDVNVGGQVNVNAAGTVFNPPGPAIGTSINMAGTDVDDTLHFPTTVTGQIFWNGVLLWPLAPPPAPGAGAASTISAVDAALQQAVPSCRQPLAASSVAVAPGNALCTAAPAASAAE